MTVLLLLGDKMASTRSLKLIASAHPMSRSSDFQFGSKRQARHLSPMVMPMLKPELASEKALVSSRGIGLGMDLERVGDPRSLAHHLRS